MISLWAFISQSDVEAYAGTLILPSYLSHLHLGTFEFASQAENGDGREPLKLTYLGDGRLEEYSLLPEDHALEMIRQVCPGIDSSRLQLPRDDAAWHWTAAEDTAGVSDSSPSMRIYFAPTTRTLCAQADPMPPSEEAYVSVSREHVFVGRPMVRRYLQGWLRFLGLDLGSADLAEAESLQADFPTPSAGVEFAAGAVGGQMFLSDEVLAEDLMHFAGLDKALQHARDFVRLDLDFDAPDGSGIFEDGIYIRLQRYDGEG